MEAIVVAGLAAVAVGGYYSCIDFMDDLGLFRKGVVAAKKKLPVSRRYSVILQPGIKKMAGMNI
jgi:hypothetical protein